MSYTMAAGYSLRAVGTHVPLGCTSEKKSISFAVEDIEKTKKSVSSKFNYEQTDFFRFSIFSIVKHIDFF